MLLGAKDYAVTPADPFLHLGVIRLEDGIEILKPLDETVDVAADWVAYEQMLIHRLPRRPSYQIIDLFEEGSADMIMQMARSLRSLVNTLEKERVAVSFACMYPVPTGRVGRFLNWLDRTLPNHLKHVRMVNFDSGDYVAALAWLRDKRRYL